MSCTDDDLWTSIGLISDTHGWLNPKLGPLFQTCDHIIHAGDIGRPEVIEQLEFFAPVSAVRGNIDGGKLRFFPLEIVLEVESFRLGVLHIAGNPYRPNAHARDFISREKLDFIVVGHSHVPVVGKVGKTIWINPGAAGREGHHDLCFAMRLHLKKNEEPKLERIELGERRLMGKSGG